MSRILSSHVNLEAALHGSLERIRRVHAAFGRRFPTVGDGTSYQLTANTNWLAGFWPGLLWLACVATGDEGLRTHAEALLPTFEERLARRVHITHDLGFLFTLSARAQWQVTRHRNGAFVRTTGRHRNGAFAGTTGRHRNGAFVGTTGRHRNGAFVGTAGRDRQARELALRAARELVQRYRPQGEYIQAWGAVGDPAEGGRMIIDTMMNLPLLFWASEQTGDPQYHLAALAHAETSLRYLLRPDGSTYHTFFLDQETGQPVGPRTHQGFADDSLWARGQAWAIYGFALAAEWCEEGRFLAAARQAARRFVAELPPDGVPWWDLRLPEDAPHHRDSSAGAVAAGGMLRLARLDDKVDSGEFRDSAVTLLGSLVAHCLETQPEAQGLLRHGTYHAHKGLGVDAYFICGDYFFLEALLALQGKKFDFWGPQHNVPE